jgi:predicted ferric reductase
LRLPETPNARGDLRIRFPPAAPADPAGGDAPTRLTAEDDYQAQRSYSIASAPEDQHLALTVERLDDGEASPYLTDTLRSGDELILPGPIGGYFVWRESLGGPLLLVGGGSGVVPLGRYSAITARARVKSLHVCSIRRAPAPTSCTAPNSRTTTRRAP